MTWTATEYETDPDWPVRTMKIRDQDGQTFCELHARVDDPAAIEQMRARARLIVQAEAMRDACEAMMSLRELHRRFQDYEATADTFIDFCNKKLAPIIKATEYDTVDRADIGHKE